MRRYSTLLIATLAALFFIISGCGSDAPESLECGPGTHPHDGACVLLCGDGTIFDRDNGECVPADQVECGDGTLFDEESGDCVPDGDISCGDGTFLGDDGTCLPEATEAQQLAEQADLNQSDGTELTAPEVDETFVFTGSAGDEAAVFHFSAQAGQWLSVTVHSLGLPSPAFRIDGPEGFERHSPRALQTSPTRPIVTPYDGEYEIHIESTVLGDAGGEFVAVLSRLPAPNAGPWAVDGAHAQGSLLDLTENLYQLEGVTATGPIEIEVLAVGADARAEILVWSDTTTLESTHSVEQGERFTIGSAPDDSLVLVDFTTAHGPALDYELRASEPVAGVLLPPGESWTQSYDIDAGRLLSVSHDNAEDRHLTVDVHQNGELVNRSADLAPLSYELDPLRGHHVRWFSEDNAELIVTVTNDHPTGIDDVSIFVDIVELDDLGDVEGSDELERHFAEALDQGESDFFVFSVAESTSVEARVTADLGLADLTFYPADDMSSEIFSGSIGMSGSLDAGTVVAEVTSAEAMPLGYVFAASFSEFAYVLEEFYELNAGEMLRIVQSNDDDLVLTAHISKSGQSVAPPLEMETGSDPNTSVGGLRWFSEIGGTYTLRFSATEPIVAEDITLDVWKNPVTDAGSLAVGDSITHDETSSRFHLLQASEPLRISGSFSLGIGVPTDINMAFLLYGLDKPNDPVEVIFEPSTHQLSFVTEPIEPGEYFFEYLPSLEAISLSGMAP